MSELRPYQVEALDAILATLSRVRSTLLYMATGAGKTRVFCEVAKSYLTPFGRVLIVAHRDELITQAARRVCEITEVRTGIEKGRHRAIYGHRVVVASVQSLKGERLARFRRDDFDLVIIDEAHRAAAKGYQAIVEHFQSAKVLGVTATPWRLDGKPLGDTFDTVAYEYPIERGIREGYLSPIRCHRVVVEGLQLGDVRRTRGDLSRKDLSRLLNDEAHIHGIVDPLLKMASERDDVLRFPRAVYRPTVVFAVDVEHGRAITDMLNRYRPRCADMVTGKQRQETRRQIYNNHSAGYIQFLVNCEVLTEGWDAPYVSCVAIARPTLSWALYSQMVGRGTRLYQGKHDCLVLDFVGNSGRHHLVGPTDVLAGRVVDDDLRAATAKIREENPETDELGILELALAWLEGERERSEAQARITAVANFYTELIDPFLGRLERPGADEEPAHAYQRKALEQLGFDLPGFFPASGAAQLLNTVQDRRMAGLCSYKMAKLLTQQKVPNAAQLTKEQAQKQFHRLQRTRWRR